MSRTNETNSTMRSAVVAGGLLLAVLAVWALTRQSNTDTRPEPPLAVLQAELTAIGTPAGATRATSTEAEARIGTVRVADRWTLQQPATDARAFLRGELTAHGWQYKSGTDGAQWSDSYCKNAMVARVQPSAPQAPTSDVSLSITWNELSLIMCGGATK